MGHNTRAHLGNPSSVSGSTVGLTTPALAAEPAPRCRGVAANHESTFTTKPTKASNYFCDYRDIILDDLCDYREYSSIEHRRWSRK